MSDGKVVVIGARGFLGRRVVQQLAQSGQFHPVAAYRGATAGPGTVACDAASAASVAEAVRGADFAINCVAGNAETMLAATRNLCAAAGAAGLKRIVHLSSMAVYGAATGLVDEAHALDPSLGWYAQVKVECEAEIQRFVAGGGDAVILRPGCIHGPGSTQWTSRIARLLRQHRLGDLGPAGDGGCNLIDVGDVAAAVEAALTRPGLAGLAFNLGDPDPGTWNEYFMALGRAIGATPVSRITGRRLKIEGKILAIPLKLAEIAAGRAKLGHLAPTPLPGSLLGLFRQDIQLDHRRADALLGFPRTEPSVAIAKAAQWFIGLRQG
jgi:nucleoside-diphosphate-sugar epimerase